MDETAIAFELPHARAAATHAGPPLDRISVRDYTRQVEIGAFRTERGVTQRIRFNVVLEVSHHTAARDDDVDKVISYDTITEAIAPPRAPSPGSPKPPRISSELRPSLSASPVSCNAMTTCGRDTAVFTA